MPLPILFRRCRPGSPHLARPAILLIAAALAMLAWNLSSGRPRGLGAGVVRCFPQVAGDRAAGRLSRRAALYGDPAPAGEQPVPRRGRHEPEPRSCRTPASRRSARARRSGRLAGRRIRPWPRRGSGRISMSAATPSTRRSVQSGRGLLRKLAFEGSPSSIAMTAGTHPRPLPRAAGRRHPAALGRQRDRPRRTTAGSWKSTARRSIPWRLASAPGVARCLGFRGSSVTQTNFDAAPVTIAGGSSACEGE